MKATLDGKVFNVGFAKTVIYAADDATVILSLKQIIFTLPEVVMLTALFFPKLIIKIVYSAIALNL